MSLIGLGLIGSLGLFMYLWLVTDRLGSFVDCEWVCICFRILV